MERVWDYPRPPALVACERRVRIEVDGEVIADSTAALRVLETTHAPTIYVPPQDIVAGALTQASGQSLCEWKGMASYFHVRGRSRAAWSYPAPVPRYAALTDHVSFYPSRMDACWMDDERVRPQEGDFYGGWITDDLVGPFKGPPGTMGW